MSKTYGVIVTREDDAWLADASDVAGTRTRAKNLPSLDHNVREAIALAAACRTDVIFTSDQHFRMIRPLTGHKAFRLLPDDI